MKTFATTVLGLGMAVLITSTALAQDPMDVTVREIQALPQDSIDALLALGSNITSTPISHFNELLGARVRIVAVVMSDPRDSGLSTPNNETGLPTRIHFFVRDTSAATQGFEGNGIQIVDDNWEATNSLNVVPGDVVEIVGTVAPFGGVMQLDPETVMVVGTADGLGLPATIMDPVTVSTSALNSLVDGVLVPNWEMISTVRDQYVLLEGVLLTQRDISSDRPNWTVSSDAGTDVYNRDISLAYRNDRDGTQDDMLFNVRTDDFTPPPPGSVINLKGFVVADDFDPFSLATVDGITMKISPMVESDLEVVESPPLVFPDPLTVVVGTDPFEATAEVMADASRSISSVTLHTYTSANADTVSVAAALTTGNTYAATVPAAGDGDFVTYWFVAVDNTEAATESDDIVYRALADGIDEIEDIQLTVDQGVGSSPFAGSTVPMNLVVTVQTDPAAWRRVGIQDDAGMAAWSGVHIDGNNADLTGVAIGDVLNITQADVVESFGATELENPVYTIMLSGAPIGPKVVTTDVLLDEAIAEAHEGMTLRFENVVITDSSAGFGEWAFSSDGTPENAILADDDATEINRGASPYWAEEMFTNGDEVEYIQGSWWYSFGSYKLVPSGSADVGAINVAVEDELLPNRFALEQNYPNPFSGRTSFEFHIPTSGDVQLEVFDMLGRRIETVVDTRMPAGSHIVTFDGSSLAAGLYFVRLANGGEVLNRSMTLVK